MNFGALNCFDSSIKKLKKALDYITHHMIYTCDNYISVDLYAFLK